MQAGHLPPFQEMIRVCVCVRARARARMHTRAFREGREQTEADREDWDVEAEGHPGTQDPR